MKYNLSVDGVSVEAVFDKLGGVEGARRFLAGNVEVTIKDHIINCNADPFVPENWKVESHKKQGELKLTREGDDLLLNGKRINFYRSNKQMGKSTMKGNDLQKELEGLKNTTLLNANVLDYLREHPDLIPESWKKDEQGNTRYIFFWGTIYRCSDGNLFVRYLYRYGGQWHWRSRWLGREWRVGDPAAVLAS